MTQFAGKRPGKGADELCSVSFTAWRDVVLPIRRCNAVCEIVMSFIETKNLIYKYEGNDVKALDDVSLNIEAGEFVALLGANGSGKSTLARHLNALLFPTSGRCVVDGVPTTEAAIKIRRTVGMVFQNPDNQLVAATVEDDVAFGPANLGIDAREIKERVDAALAAVDMTDYRRHAPHLLSGGQKQRVAIAGCLAMKQKAIVLDEPTAMLDPKGRAEVLAAAKKLHADGVTVIYVTHFMEEAAAADRVIVMEGGKIADDGSPREIFAQNAVMKKRGLEVPFAALAAEKLRQKGVELPKDILNEDELVTAILKTAGKI